MDEDEFLLAVDALCDASQPKLSRLAAAILVAAAFGICHDSRAFARRFDIAHALVLRECAALSSELGLIELGTRDERTQRQAYRLSSEGRKLATDVGFSS